MDILFRRHIKENTDFLMILTLYVARCCLLSTSSETKYTRTSVFLEFLDPMLRAARQRSFRVIEKVPSVGKQTFVVEYIVGGQMCDDCRRVEAKDTWNASVQVCHLSGFLVIYTGLLLSPSSNLTTGAAEGRPEEDALLPRAAAHQVRGHQGVLRHPAQRRGARLLLRIGVGGQGRIWARLASRAYYFICNLKLGSILHGIVIIVIKIVEQ